MKKQEKIFKYLKKEIPNINKGNEGFLKFLFPNCNLFYDYLPTFYDESKYTILIDTNKDKAKKVLMDMSEKLLIVYYSNRNTVDSKKGFLSLVVEGLGLRVSDKQLKLLNTLEDNEYWFTLKLWYTLNEILEIDEPENNTGIFNLFKSLYIYDFSYLYNLYSVSEEPYMKVLSTLITMEDKAKNLENQINLSPYYRKVLESHVSYLPKFSNALFNFSQSNATEFDFLKFLSDCSKD